MSDLSSLREAVLVGDAEAAVSAAQTGLKGGVTPLDIDVCRRMRERVDGPLWIKPNAGQPELVNGRPVYRATPEEFAARVVDLVQAGATFVGGCCGTNPDFVRAIVQALKR